MAPVNICDMVMTTKDKIKLRKPVVEKMRRDRINSSIEQLKTLLKTELQAHQPNSKLEKADILETAVVYLKDNSMRPAASFNVASPVQSYAEGFTRCLEETLRFLSAKKNQPTGSQQKLLNHFHRAQKLGDRVVLSPNRATVPHNSSTPKRVTPGGRGPLWRPW
ncbi:transcription factor HES-5-like [Salvelinus sp. IW2-2015]|uniref:transcription factor HES-5-like n=1 Tax=Salvelinus sp. IW2-2015 TaxID=2691554 RepID=UPI000CDF6675|nr:transcription factor HES-5-like [Salvelinus alpinus]